MNKMTKRAFALTAVAVLALSGCSSQAGEKIVIGSQAYYSNEIVAEMYAQVLEDAGYQVERQFSLGQRDIYMPAILAGEVDLFPEYTGNLLQYLNPTASETSADAVYSALVSQLPDGIVALEMSQASDQDSYNVTGDFAAKNNLVTIADLAKLTNVRLGGAAELAERPYGPSGLLSVYGVSTEFEATGDTTVESLVAGQIDMANVFSADPRIQKLGLVTLQDPDGLFLASNVVPIATSAVDSKAKDLINSVSRAMSVSDLVGMNVRSVDEKLSAAEIARDWLKSKGLLK